MHASSAIVLVAILAPRADGPSAGSLARAVDSLRAALAARGVAAPDRSELRARRDAAVGDLSEARVVLADASRRFGEMDFEGATAEYERGSALLEARHADLLGDPEVVQAAFGVARAHLARADVAAAREEIRRALAVDPTLRLDPADHPPDLVALVEEMRAEADASVWPGPPPERMCAAARALGASHAATIELRQVGGRPELTLEIRDSERCTRTGSGVAAIENGDDPSWSAASTAVTEEAIPSPRMNVPGPVTTRPDPITAAPPPPGPSWWSRWYVWAGAGAVVTGVAAALLLPTLEDDSVRHDGGVGL